MFDNNLNYNDTITLLYYISIDFLGLTGSTTAGSPFSPFWPKAPPAPATCSYRKKKRKKTSTGVTFFTQQLKFTGE